MGPMKTASAHKQVYKIFKKGVGHELFLNQNLGHAAKKFGNHWPKAFCFKTIDSFKIILPKNATFSTKCTVINTFL